MIIIRAEHLGMCFGVRDAIDLARKHAEVEPLTVLGELVHNEAVLADLRSRGVALEGRAEQAATNTVMVTAHGASERALRKARALGLNVLEATCPLVRAAHRALAGLVDQGYHPVVVGRRDHVEVRGLTEDLAECDVILSEADVERLPRHPRFGIIAQTTQPVEKVRHLVACLRRRFPESAVRWVDTVCQPTKLRQHAAVELARQCQMVVVIGGAHSNNTRELAETCRRFCPRVFQVQTAADLRAEWFVGVRTVGLTAGTSTPDGIIDEVESWLWRLAEPVPAVRTADRPAPASMEPSPKETAPAHGPMHGERTGG
jgi:4-hydroxy-3-methylbut-2-enyl diphosphate reductase